MLHGNLTGFNAFTPAVAGTGYIQSKQDFSITIGSGATSNTATISSVDTSKAFIVVSGFRTTITSRNGSTMMPRVELTNGTTVTATRGATSTLAITVVGHVVEFIPSAISSIQRGTIVLNAATSNTATVTSVDTTRAVLFFMGTQSAETTANLNTFQGNITLTNATTVTASLATAGVTSTTFGYELVEFATGVISSLQYINATGTLSGATYTSTISSVDTSRVLISYLGESNNNPAYQNHHRVVMTNATTLTYTRTNVVAVTRTISTAIVEFVAGVLNQATQEIQTTLASVISNTSTITSVNTSKAVVMGMGYSTANTGDPRLVHMTGALTNSTTLTVTSELAGTITRDSQNDVIEFA